MKGGRVRLSPGFPECRVNASRILFKKPLKETGTIERKKAKRILIKDRFSGGLVIAGRESYPRRRLNMKKGPAGADKHLIWRFDKKESQPKILLI